jgi:hypothetical protein
MTPRRRHGVEPATPHRALRPGIMYNGLPSTLLEHAMPRMAKDIRLEALHAV